MIKCVAIDDEPLALELMREHISSKPSIELIATFNNPIEGRDFLRDHKVDLLFLDIQMPGMTGIELLKSINAPEAVIFTTAYPQYAVTGYELNALDFLLKPIEPERFEKAVTKALQYFQYTRQLSGREFIFVKSEYQLMKIDVGDIRYIEGLDDYVKIYVQGPRPILSHITMKALHEKLPKENFIRVHRSFIVPLSKIESVRNKKIRIGEKEIPLGESYQEEFMRIFMKG
ncbi:MAG: LytTR family DNA-binding domain-containing protein [Chitinophagales bacterium]